MRKDFIWPQIRESMQSMIGILLTLFTVWDILSLASFLRRKQWLRETSVVGPCLVCMKLASPTLEEKKDRREEEGKGA